MSTQMARFVAGVQETVRARGPEEHRWFADWSADFDEAQREGDGDTVTLLMDTLIAFSTWLDSRQSASP